MEFINLTRYRLAFVMDSKTMATLPAYWSPPWLYRLYGEHEPIELDDIGLAIDCSYIMSQRVINVPDRIAGVMYIVEQAIADKLTDRADILILSETDIKCSCQETVIVRNLIRN